MEEEEEEDSDSEEDNTSRDTSVTVIVWTLSEMRTNVMVLSVILCVQICWVTEANYVTTSEVSESKYYALY